MILWEHSSIERLEHEDSPTLTHPKLLCDCDITNYSVMTHILNVFLAIPRVAQYLNVPQHNRADQFHKVDHENIIYPISGLCMP